MTLLRIQKGLLETPDDFGSDSRANYDPLTGPIGWAAGYITLPSGDTCERSAYNNVGCVTARVLNTSNYASGAWLGKNYPLSVSGDADGYCAYIIPSSWAFRRVTDDAVTSLGTNASNFPASAAYGVVRTCITPTGVRFTTGTTSLANVNDYADQTYTGAFYGGVRSPNAANLQTDWLELRITYTVVFTGLPTGWWIRCTNSEANTDAQESSGNATADLSQRLFGPSNYLTRVGVYNGNPAGAGVEQDFVTNATYTDMGGGDIFTFQTKAQQGRFPVAGMRLFQPQYNWW